VFGVGAQVRSVFIFILFRSFVPLASVCVPPVPLVCSVCVCSSVCVPLFVFRVPCVLLPPSSVFLVFVGFSRRRKIFFIFHYAESLSCSLEVVYTIRKSAVDLTGGVECEMVFRV
jgi:hypothetical protein